MSNQRSYVKTLKYQEVPIRANVIDGREVVELQRTRADVLLGKKTDPERCMDANCMIRLAGNFPHRVMAVWVFKSTAFVLKAVNRSKGTYTVVRYLHYDGKDIDRFDKNMKVEAAKTFTLHPPGKGNRIGSSEHRDYASENGDHGKRQKMPRKWAPRGQNARFTSLRKWEEMRAAHGPPTA